MQDSNTNNRFHIYARVTDTDTNQTHVSFRNDKHQGIHRAQNVSCSFVAGSLDRAIANSNLSVRLSVTLIIHA